MRERPHVAGALHIVLAAHRVHADAIAADVAGRHGEIGDRNHRRRTLAVLGDAEAVIDGPVSTGRKEARGFAQLVRVNSGGRLGGLGRVPVFGDQARPGLKAAPVAAFAHEGLLDEAFGDDDMRQRVEEGDVGPRLQREMVVGLDMCRSDQIDAPGGR